MNDCRVCLTKDVSIMFHLSDLRDDKSLAEILGFISGIEIDFSENQLPQKICSYCTEHILAASTIKQKVLATDLLLRAEIKDETQIKTELLEEDPISDLHGISLLTSEEFVQFTTSTEANCEEITKKELCFDENIKKTTMKLKKNVKRKKISTIAGERKNKVPNELDYKCFICNLVFDKISSKNNHVKSDHENERICKLCQVKCKTAISLETHVKFHFRDTNFMCEICSKTFRYQNRLRSHMALHHSKAVEMSCDLCGLHTKFKNNIKRHMNSVHMKLRAFKCTQCSGHQYSTQEALNSHLYRYHNVSAPIKCPDCLHGFTFDSELRAHKKHGFCSNNVNTPFVRRGKTHYDHLEIVDQTGEHVCKICNEVFPSKNKFSMHNYLKHKYSNKCEECNVLFTNYTSLIRHQKVKHEGKKPFSCEFCSKSFGQKVSLISHRNTHTGEKSFSCAYCSFRSGDHGTVSKHKKKLHPEMMMVTSKSTIVGSF